MGGVQAAAARFSGGQVAAVQEYGSGNVNDTFLVSSADDPDTPFILQRLNTHVFPQPEMVMQNLKVLTEHVGRRLLENPSLPGRRWEIPRVILTQNGMDHWRDPQGCFWRALSFIGSSRTHDRIQNRSHAEEVGYALGLFHLLVSDLQSATLADTLPGFHVTPGYLQHYDEVSAQCGCEYSPEAAFAREFIKARRGWVPVLEQARLNGTLATRPIHGDPKINNVLLDVNSGRAVGLIDLDTFKPGLIHYDIGDCLRSGCNPLGEETTALDDVRFETDYCRAILAGYLSRAREFLTDSDYDYLYDGIRLIAFELGLRFFTDYLTGNVYFKARHPRHNLDRSLVQFKLTESIAAQEASIRALIHELK